MFRPRWISVLTLVSAVGLSGCKADGPTAEAAVTSSPTSRVDMMTIPSGTTIEVTLNSSLTSESASVGDSWTGTVSSASFIEGRNVIPAGTVVSGTVTASRPAAPTSRAMLDLALNSITVDEHRYPVHGSAEAVIAGSARARSLSVITRAAPASDAIIEDTSVSNSGLNAASLATGFVAFTKNNPNDQVVLRPGTAFTFTTEQSIAVRY